MPVTIDEFVRIVETAAPRELAYDWDNSGLLLRCGHTVSRVLIALDATMPVAQEAREKGCDMLLVHHPLIFSPVKALSLQNSADAVLMALIRSGISLYAAHTTFDRAAGGINDALAQTLGLSHVTAVSGEGELLMRVGELGQTLDKHAFIAHVKQALGIPTVKVSAADCGGITRVAVAGGSGGSFIAAAKNAGAQALVTGEAKHHHYIDAEAAGLLLIEAGHYHTECAFSDRIDMSLQSYLNEVQLDLGLIKAENDKAPYAFG